jgi:hypothetical protein
VREADVKRERSEPQEPPQSRALTSGAEISHVFSKPPVLRGERLADYKALLDALTREIKPSGVIEQLYVTDISCFVWEIVRLRRCKTAIINASYRSALEDLLPKLTDGSFISARDRAKRLALEWFTGPGGKEKITEILAQFGLDESVIEAEAIRQCFRDVEVIEKLLTGLEARRDKALACIAHYRASFAEQVRDSSLRLIEQETDKVPRVQEASVIDITGVTRGQ